MSRAVLVLMLVVLSCLASGSAAAAGLAAPDRRARAQARAVLEGARTPEHRRDYRLVVPNEPSRLPARYVIAHHSNFIAFVESSRVISVERDADGARVELLDPEGVARAPLPAGEVDAFVRLAYYLSHARSVQARPIFSGGGAYASHVASRRIHIEGEGLSLTTTYAQPIVDEVEYGDLEHFVLTQLTERLEAMVDAHVTAAHRVPLDDVMLADIERRLRAIPRGDTPLSQYDRDDRDAVVARLLAQQLVNARVEPAVPLLRRKGLDEQAFLLALRTTPVEDLPLALPGLLCSNEWDLHHPALQLAEEHREQSRAALLYALGCRLSDDKVERLLDALARAPKLEEQSLRPVRRLISNARSPKLRIAAAKTLWVIERDEAAEQLLRSVALGGGRPQALQDVQLDAFMAIAAGIDRKGPERRVVAELALEVLRGIPMATSGERLSVSIVMEKLWQYGDAQDGEALLPWLEHADPGLASDAVEFMERLDPELARSEARERVRRYARGVGRADYAHAVGPFVQLLVRHEEQAALDDLHAATVLLRAEAPAARDPRRRAHAALVGYLEAAPTKKAEALVHWLERTPELERLTHEVLRGRHGLDEAAFDRAEAVARASVTPPAE
jgi:hypothetical protein